MFPNAHNVDARGATFNNVGRDQINVNIGRDQINVVNTNNAGAIQGFYYPVVYSPFCHIRP